METRFSSIVMRNLEFWIEQILHASHDNYSKIKSENVDILKAFEIGINISATQLMAIKLLVAAAPIVERFSFEEYWIPVLEKIATSELLGNTKINIILINRLAIFYLSVGNIPKSKQYFLQTECNSSGNELFLARKGLAIVYINFSKLNIAEDYAHKILEGLKKSNDPNPAIGVVKNILGMVAHKKGQYSEAETYFRSAKILFSKSACKMNSGYIFNNLALSLFEQNKFDLALRYLSKTRSNFRSFGEESMLNRLDLNHGLIHLKMGNRKKAMLILNKVFLSNKLSPRNYSSLAYAHANYGAIYLLRHKISESKYHLYKAKNYFDIMGLRSKLLGREGKLPNNTLRD